MSSSVICNLWTVGFESFGWSFFYYLKAENSDVFVGCNRVMALWWVVRNLCIISMKTYWENKIIVRFQWITFELTESTGKWWIKSFPNWTKLVWKLDSWYWRKNNLLKFWVLVSVIVEVLQFDWVWICLEKASNKAWNWIAWENLLKMKGSFQ